MRPGGGEIRHREELVWLVPMIGAALGLFALASLAGARHGISAATLLGQYGFTGMRIVPLLVEIAALAMLARALLSRSSSPIRFLLEPFRRRFASPLLAGGALMPVIVMPVLFVGYGIFKMLLPLHLPFAWDDSFAAADRLLFFGYQPWTFTHAVFGSLEATLVIDRLYTLWILTLTLAIFGFALLAPRYDRARFFLAFTGGWLLLGVVGAYLFSSAGPCFAALTGAASASEFAPLMERLHGFAAGDGTHVDAVRWQSVLWEAHVDRHYAFGMGISAMPSLHNAIATLYALALFRFGRAAGIAATCYAAAIFIGSIHLGWHYAVDGLASAAAMVAIWWAAGRYLARTGYAAAVAEPEQARADDDPVAVAA